MLSSSKPKVMHYECLHEYPNGHVTHSYGVVSVFSEKHGEEMIRRWNIKPKNGLVEGTRYTYKTSFFAEE